MIVASAVLSAGIDVNPLEAANTAAEHLVDSDGDGVGDRRPFAGNDRYATALDVAHALAERLGGLGSVRTAIVTSGRSPVDAAAAVGLAGREQAPLLLTPPLDLHRGVAEFLDDHGVARVFIVGGPEAVSQQVADQIGAVVSEPEVIRLAGEDRYSTAAAVASQIGSTGWWCDSDGAAALLVDGTDGSLAGAVAAGPLAARLGMPIVLSSPAGLPGATAQFVQEFDIDHVVIIGIPERIPESIESELSHAGAQTVTRISGDTAAGLAAAVADTMLGDCRAALGTAIDSVALSRPDEPADGLAAAPLLGAGMDGSGAVPLLFAGESLPSATAERLKRTPIEVEGQRVHLRLVALGGHDAVSKSAMAEALAAGATAGPFSATIEAVAGDDFFTITLSDPLSPAPEAGGPARDMLYVNGVPAALASQGSGRLALDIQAGESCELPRVFLVNLQHELEAGDVIELEPSDYPFGANGDRRPLSPARFEVPEPQTDTEPPGIAVVAPLGAHAVRIVASDDSGPDGLKFDPTRVVVISARGARVRADTGYVSQRSDLFGFTAFDVELSDAGLRDEPDDGYGLEAGDRIFVRSGAVTDAAGNRSRNSRTNVAPPRGPLRPVSIQIARVNHDDSADDSGRASATFGGVLRIAARADALGSTGNQWQVRFGRLSTHDPRAEPVEISIALSERDTLVSIRFDAGTPTVGQLVTLLNEHSQFAARFEASAEASVSDCTVDARPISVTESDFKGETTLGGGLSEFDITVRFSGNVSEYLSDGYTGDEKAREFADDVFSSLIEGYSAAAAVAAGDTISVDAPIPFDQVRFRYTTTAASHDLTLSQHRRQFVDIRAGLARGYLADDPATETDERFSSDARLRAQLQQ